MQAAVQVAATYGGAAAVASTDHRNRASQRVLLTAGLVTLDLEPARRHQGPVVSDWIETAFREQQVILALDGDGR